MKILSDIIIEAIEKLKNFHEDSYTKPLKANIILIADKIEGHYCSNILFLIKKSLKKGFEIDLLNILENNELILKAEIVSGYLNLTLSEIYFKKSLIKLQNENILPNLGKKQKVNVEYCSINPTGFLHIGHARNAILGDAIARILIKLNYDVTKEYYVNNAGNQIQMLAKSIYARFCEQNGINYEFPIGGYVGNEIYDIAKLIKKDQSLDEIGSIAIDYFLKEIKKDLEAINIFHDKWIYESEIIANNYIEKAIKILKEKGFIEYGLRNEKQVEKGKISKNDLMLLKTTKKGDDQDRPLTKEDGSWTYFAPDIGYHLYKIERNFEYLICVLGADHDSYANRIKIATNLLKEDIIHKICVCQMVSFEDNGNLVKFSKRLGNSVKVSDFIKIIQPDILRFMILEKSCNTQVVFDYEKATTISMKNPLFYCQYAYARGCSILRNIGNENFDLNIESDFFKEKEAQELIIQLEQFENNIIEAAKELSPHILINYLKKLSEKLHQLWQAGKIDQNKRIIIENNPIETNKRAILIRVYLKIAKECFEALGITALEKME